MLALGAGVYEELLFRVLLVSAITFLARRVFRWRPSVAAVLAVVVSALVFAAFHYIGPYGDPLRVDSFVFRFIGGLAFSVLYVTPRVRRLRAAWTHSLYDLLVLVARKAGRAPHPSVGDARVAPTGLGQGLRRSSKGDACVPLPVSGRIAAVF